MKWRMLGAFTGIVGVVLLAQNVPLASYLRSSERAALLSSLQRDAFIIAGTAEDLLSGEDPRATLELLTSTIDQYSAETGAKVVVVDASGYAVASSDPTDEAGKDYSGRAEIDYALAGQPASGERTSTAVGDIVYVAVPVLSGGMPEGAVRLTFPAEVFEERAESKLGGIVIVGIISLVGAAIAAFFVSGTITSPIRRLQRSTERLASGDFDERAEADSGAKEIRSLARSFNSMTERISGLLDQQRQFAGDASHQLRTPLTALRLQLERAAAMVENDPGGARERIEAAGEETERLQRLVEGLLMMARSEGTSPDLHSVDVAQVVNERLETWSPYAEERGIRLVSEVSGDVRAMAAPLVLEQILDNYIDNAIGAARSGDTVLISARQSDSGIEVHIIDEGPGIDASQIDRAFDRFWRAPGAPQGGSGIGLAIVRHLAELSGGSASIANRTDRSGLDAWVTLPAGS